MHGSWVLLIMGQFLLVLACAAVATLLFFITLDVTRAMSLVAGLTAPAFAFMGVTFPSTDMPFIAQLWRSLLPISHYISIQIQQVNYATSLTASVAHYLALIAFVGCFYVSKIILIKRQKALKQQPLNVIVESTSNDTKRPG
jgi:ABC-2 type transport system permease protein